MRRVVSLYGTTVGKKVLMAVSGVVLFGFVFGHMIGNLKMLLGADAMNGYAEWLREVGYPALPHMGFLWIFRFVLLAAVLVHIVAAVQLVVRSRGARREGYRKAEDLSFAYASRTMRWGGVILLVFVVYHILHFTTGQAHSAFVAGDAYRNYVVAFQSPVILGVYAVAQLALSLHIYHGVWSAFQTLGANHPKVNHLRRPLAIGLALLVFVGFLTPAVMVFAGAISF
jgi:succinate dehydrogenase cytochrome b subunit